MSVFQRPRVVRLAALALAMLVMVPASYAVVTKVFLTVDTDKPASELEADLRHQLEQAGIDDTTVAVEETEGEHTKVSIMARHLSDDGGELPEFEVNVIGSHTGPGAEALRVELDGDGMSPEQLELVRAALMDDDTIAALHRDDDDRDDAEVASDLEAAFAAQGVGFVSVSVDAGSVLIRHLDQ